MRALRWIGLAGAVLLCLAAVVSEVLPWAVGRPDGYLMVGVDFSYIDRYLPSPLHPVIDFFVNTHTSLSVIAFILAGTVGVRGRRARCVAAVAAVLALVMSCVNALSRWVAVDPELGPSSVLRDRLYAALFAVLAVVLLVATALLIVRLYAIYDGFVIAFLLLVAGVELVAVGIVFGSTRTADLTPLVILPGLAHTGAAVSAVVATVGAGLSTRSRPAPPPPPGFAGPSIPATSAGGPGRSQPRDGAYHRLGSQAAGA